MKETNVVPNDFLAAVNDIKLAILQARARAARLANAEALKLYFYVGGYVSNKTRRAKWGTGAINALSERLQVELPGLRGFSPSSIKFMRLLYEGWMSVIPIRYLAINELPGEARHVNSLIRQSAINELSDADLTAFFSVGFTHHMRILFKTKDVAERWFYIHACSREHWTVEQLQSHLAADDYKHVGALPNNFAKLLPIAQATKAVRSFRDEYLLELVNLGQLSQYLSVLDATERKPNENPSIGILLCEKVNKPVVQLTVQGYSQPIGIATYQALKNIPQPYKSLAPVIDGVRRVMVEYKDGLAKSVPTTGKAKKRKAVK